jgi:lipid II:glycine glycyltransferase (peptidoglycan interpeptide bridge formation enzyme)
MASPPTRRLAIDGVSPSETIVVDLTSGEAELWKKIKKNTRNQVRQARKAGVEIAGPESDDKWIPEYYDILSDTYRRRDMTPPTSIDFYRQLWQHLYLSGLLTVLMARLEGRIVAGGIYLLWDGVIYGIDGAMDRQFMKKRPNNLVEWETIAWGANSGYTSYDMLGADIPSIAKFKLGFSGRIEPYDKLEIQPSLTGRLAYSLYGLFQSKIKKFFRI